MNIPSNEQCVGEEMKTITSYYSIVHHRFEVESRPGDKPMFGCRRYWLGVTSSVVALTGSSFGLVVVVDDVAFAVVAFAAVAFAAAAAAFAFAAVAAASAL